MTNDLKNISFRSLENLKLEFVLWIAMQIYSAMSMNDPMCIYALLLRFFNCLGLTDKQEWKEKKTIWSQEKLVQLQY